MKVFNISITLSNKECPGDNFYIMNNKRIINTIIIIITLCLVSVFNLAGQTDRRIEEDYNRFKETFIKEINSLPTSGSAKINFPYHIAPAKLPDWFFKIPLRKADTSFAIGISDPGLSHDKRLDQAISRAKGMAVLLRNVKIKYLRNIYNADYLENRREDFLSKFEELYQLIPVNVTEQFAWDTVSVDTTKFSETIVLLKIFPAKQEVNHGRVTDAYNIFCFNTEYRKSGKFELNSKVEIFCDTLSSEIPEGELKYTWNEISKIANIKSWYDNMEPIQSGYYKYKASNDTLISDINRSSGRSLYYGLWFGYINTLLKSLQNIIKPENLLIQNVDEHYSKKFQDFSREISVMHTAIELDKILISNNKIYVNLAFNQ